MSDAKEPESFDPLNTCQLAESVARALLLSRRHGLVDLRDLTFPGAGIYAIYYSGQFPAYAALACEEDGPKRSPIYVGCAEPEGARKGTVPSAPTRKLCGRLKKHTESISQAENLELADFSCRFLVVDPVWIPLAERLLLERFKPVWNQVLDGFGNHPPGKGRRNGKRPAWDTVHPGRLWAAELAENPIDATEWLRKVSAHLDEAAHSGDDLPFPGLE